VGQMKIGRRLSIKILNASKFVLGIGSAENPAAITEPLDRAMLALLADRVEACTAAFEDYNYARALELAEEFFWSFTDDHVELVKDRAYGGQGEAAAASAQAALATALSVMLRLFAPFTPFVTEEVWSWWHEGSIHRAEWPSAAEIRTLAADGDSALIADLAVVLSSVRRAKSEAKVSMKAEIESLTVSATAATIARLQTAAGDLNAVGRIKTVTWTSAEGPIETTATLTTTV
jgi:valyl-tRNA synthetase